MESMRYLAFAILAASLSSMSQASDTLPTETYELQKYCNVSEPELPIQKAAFVILNRRMLLRTPCFVRVRSMWATDDGRLRLQIFTDDLNVPCNDLDRYANLQIYNYEDSGRLSSISYPDKICSGGYTSYQAMYLNSGTTMVLALRVDLELLPYVSLRLLFTSTGFSHEADGDDFLCTNNLRVAVQLKCDGNNNCGDGSDETESECDRWTTKLKWVSIGFGLFALLVSICLAVALCKRKPKPKPMVINHDDARNDAGDEGIPLLPEPGRGDPDEIVND